MTPIPGKLYKARYSQAHSHLHDKDQSTIVRMGSILLFLGADKGKLSAVSNYTKYVFLTTAGTIIYFWLNNFRNHLHLEELEEESL